MTRITCQAIHTGDGITFIWSEGKAFFEPYTLAGNDAVRLRTASKKAWDVLRSGANGPALAQAGHELYTSIFQGDKGRAVGEWLSAQGKSGDAQLDIVTNSLTEVPWTAVYDSPPRGPSFGPEDWQAFWGCRYSLTTTRRVNAARFDTIVFQPRVLVVVDPAIKEKIPEKQRDGLWDFIESKNLPVVESSSELFNEIDSHPPDILCFFGRSDGPALILGEERIALTELAEAFDADDGMPMVILNIASDVPLSLSAIEQSRLARLVTVMSPVAAETANEFGLELLRGFVYDGQPIGRFLQSQRRSSPQIGLAVSAFCPGSTRIVWNEADAETGDLPPAVPLPQSPYRPLLAYEREDRALFAGREQDVLRFCETIDAADSQVAILNGQSGCGKTSFLRAGVLPFLEDESVGYLALRDRSDEEPATVETDYAVLAIRPGPDLAGQLAAALVAFCARPFVYSTPTGQNVAVDLPEILRTTVQSGGPSSTAIRPASADAPAPPPLPPAQIDSANVCDALNGNESLLGTLLTSICERLPFELVIVIEQAEELITQSRGAAARDRRRRALGMLAQAVAARPRCKFILSLRTDFFGHVYDKLPDRLASTLREFLLPPLRQEQLSLALLYPTADEPPPYASEVPLQKYGFQFEPGLAEQIAGDVQQVSRERQESAAALMQAVAAGLYDLVKDRVDRVARPGDLRRLGGVEGALGRLVEQRIKHLQTPYSGQKALRELIPLFFTKQADGSVYRNLASSKEVNEAWRGSMPVQEVVGAASDETAGILEVQQFVVDGQEELYVGLTQDSLARVAVEWEEEKRRKSYASSRVLDFLWIGIPLTLLLVVITWALTRRMSGDSTQAGLPENIQKEFEKQLEKAVDAELGLLRWPLYVGQIQQAQRAWNEGNIVRMRQFLLSQQAVAKDDDARGFEWYYLWRLANRQKHTLAGHQGALTATAMTPGGQLLASGSHDGAVKLWDPKTGLVQATLQASGPVHAVTLSSDAKTVAAGAKDGTISIWNVKEAKDYQIIEKADSTLKGHKGAVLTLAFAPDGQSLLSAGEDHELRLWNIAKGVVQQTFKNHTAPVYSVAFAADGKRIASAGNDQQLIVWGIDGKSLHTIRVDGNELRSVMFSPNGKLIAAGGKQKEMDIEAGIVRIFDADSGKPTGPTIRHGSEVLSIAFLEDKTLATAGGDHALRIWDAEKGTAVGVLRGHLGAVRSIAASGDGRTIATASFDNTVKIWDIAAATESNTADAHKGGVNALALVLEDRFAATGGNDGAVRFWDVSNGSTIHSLPPQAGRVTALAASPDGKTLAAAHWNDKNQTEVKLWELQTDKMKLTSKQLHVLKRHTNAVNSLTFAPNGKTLASSSLDGTIILWDATSGKEKATLKGHEGAVRTAAFAIDDGDTLISGGDDGKIRLWSVKGGNQVGVFVIPLDKEKVKEVSFPLEGHSAAITGLIYLPLEIVSTSRDGTIKLWSLQAGKDVATMRGHTQGVLTTTLSGRLLVTGGADGAVRLWDAGAGVERFAFTGHTAPVRAIAATRDRTLIISASADGTLRFWRAAPEPPSKPKE